MTTDLLIYGVSSLGAILSGGIAGGFVAWKLHHREPGAELATTKSPNDADDAEFTYSEIDLASVRWQEANHLPPEAAGLMAARLKTLHKIGKGKGWF